MKKLALILAVLTILPFTQSCDVFRKIAGRPTSGEIETIKMVMEQELEEYRNKIDSIEIENQRIVDSISNIGVAHASVRPTVTEPTVIELVAAEPTVAEPVATESTDTAIPRTSTPTELSVGGKPLYTLSTIPHSYYVVVGTFSELSNAEKKIKEVASQGYQGDLIAYRNGYTAVGICPSDDLYEVNASLKKIKNGGICREAWIIARQ